MLLGAVAAESVEHATGLRPRTKWLAAVALLGVLPAVVTIAVFVTAIESDTIATDFLQFYGAAEAILRGDSPYVAANVPNLPWGGPYPYPPLAALAATPLTLVSFDVAGVLVMAALVGAALATLWVLGVRDWRCYGAALLWPPVISAVQTANVTLWFALALAVVWRFRDRLLPVAGALGLTLAVKFFLWPIVVWLTATRRLRAALFAVVTGALLLLLSWVPLGFSGLLDYPDLVRRLEATVGEDSYTLYIVMSDVGAPSPLARAVWLVSGLALIGAVVALARRGDERSAFVVAIAASLALTPIVWLHYFALLLVIVAVAQPTLGAVWFVPLLMVVTPGSGHPTPFETAWTLAVALATVALALRASRSEGRGVDIPARSVLRPAVDPS